MIGEDDSAIEL